jgi:hypothetical protein
MRQQLLTKQQSSEEKEKTLPFRHIHCNLNKFREGIFSFEFGRTDISEDELPYILTTYKLWVKESTSIVMYNHTTNEIEFHRAAKRGNFVYRKKIEERIDRVLAQLEESHVEDYFVRQCNRRFVSNAFFITLTWDVRRYPNRYLSWKFGVMKQYNNFINALKKDNRFGKLWAWRVLESTKKGYPHIHLVVICDKPHEVFKHKKKWRLCDKATVSDCWSAHVDVEAIDDMKGLSAYLKADLQKQLRLKGKQAELSMAMNWIFGKRSFSIGSNFEFIKVCVTQTHPALEQIQDLEKKGRTLLGFTNLSMGNLKRLTIKPNRAVLTDLSTYISSPTEAFEKLLFKHTGIIYGFQ